MDKSYKITIETPDGTVFAIEKIDTASTPANGLDEIAKDVLGKYYAKYVHVRHHQARIVKAGLTQDVVKCYLKGMTIREAMNWLKENRSFVATKSTIGRYWARFHALGITPQIEQPGVRKTDSISG